MRYIIAFKFAGRTKWVSSVSPTILTTCFDDAAKLERSEVAQALDVLLIGEPAATVVVTADD